MTLESDTTTAAPMRPGVWQEAPPSRRAATPVALGIAALVVLAFIAWGVWAAVALSGVRVVYDTQPVVCDGAQVGRTAQPEDSEFRQPIIDLTPGMTCELRIHVINDGWVDATVTTVGLRGLGAGNALGLVPRIVNPNGQELREQPDGGDALFDIMGGITVAPGETATFTALFDYVGGAQLDQCTESGWNPPLVTVTAPGVTRDVSPSAESLIWVRMGAADDCM